MKSNTTIGVAVLFMSLLISCSKNENSSDMNIILLHHSTGEILWNGSPPSLLKRAVKKVSSKLVDVLSVNAQLPMMFEKYNEEHGKKYHIEEMDFPKAEPYGWNNNPFDYYNIWVNNAGENPYKGEPTLEILTKDFQVIIFKHCFPVSNIQQEQDTADINSFYRSISNYKLQYNALRDKLQSFPDTKFILFTGAAQVQGNITEEEALRAREFFTWVIKEWDLPGDNIYIWDFYNLQTEGELYFKENYASGINDSHPNREFASSTVKLLFNRIIDIIDNKGENTTLKGELK